MERTSSVCRVAVCCSALAIAGLGCASWQAAERVEDATPDQVDRPWGPADEAALEELAEAAASREVPEVVTAEEAPVVPSPATSAEGGPLLEVYAFDIGQADALLVIGPAPDRKTLLVDLGHPTGGSRLPPGFTASAAHVVDRIAALTGRREVDYFLLSHYHSDHAGFGAGREEGWGTGIIGLLSDFSVPFAVGTFIHVGDGGAEHMAGGNARGVHRTIQRRMPSWEQYGRVGSSQAPRFGTTQIDLGAGVSVDVLAFAGETPDGGSAFARVIAAGVDYQQTPGNENDLSIALEVAAGECELFTAGDLTGTDDPVQRPLYVRREFEQRTEIYTNVEHHLVSHWDDSGRESDVEIYRANHHGSRYSTTPRLLAALDPELVLYSTGADHAHPSNAVVERGGDTAQQLATTWVNDLTVFRHARGRRVGEIAIVVARDGASFTVNGETHPCFTDAAEAAGEDEAE
jgi:beta-lactamase superfamily II metal-dependent hydrolase